MTPAEAAWTGDPDSAEALEMQELKESLSTVEQAGEATQTMSRAKSGSGCISL